MEARLWEHNAGVVEGYTHKRRPVVLVFAEVFERVDEGIARERQIKGWSRAKKDALIARQFDVLPALSARGPVALSAKRGRPRPSRLASRAPQDEG